MKTLNEITNGYLSMFEHTAIMTVASRLDVVDTETTEDMMYPDCSSHFITKDMEAEYDPTDDYTKDTETTEDMMHEDGSSYFTTKDMRTEAMYSDHLKLMDVIDSAITLTTQLAAQVSDYVKDAFSTGLSIGVIDYSLDVIEAHFDDAWAQLVADTDDYTKDTEVPDYSTKPLNATQYKAELIETMAASCTELNWFQISELIDQLSDMSDYYANI